MIIIDEKKCIGCGVCVSDCFPKHIILKDNLVQPTNKRCIECGHCVAICPQNAVSLEGYDMKEVQEYERETFHISSQNLLHFIQFRRSVRQFTNQEVKDETIKAIIEAGRFTPTASNAQPVSYIVVREKLPQLTTLALASLHKFAQNLIHHPNASDLQKGYAKRWIQMYESHVQNPEQPTDLFFQSKVIVLVVSNSPIDAGLAASNMELMANAQGLGVVYSGFFVRAAANSEKIREFLQLEPQKEVVACLVLGYPKVKYERTVPRRPAKVSWM